MVRDQEDRRALCADSRSQQVERKEVSETYQAASCPGERRSDERRRKKKGRKLTMVMTQWLAERMDAFVAVVTPLSVKEEQTIAEVCAREIAAWRARPTMRVLASLKVPMTDARNLLRARLAVTERNSWLNPRTEQREHLALKYL